MRNVAAADRLAGQPEGRVAGSPDVGRPGLRWISGWGGSPVLAEEILSEDLERATENEILSRGLGRAYGDSALPPASHPRVVATPLADRILAFDEETGVLRAEAGFSLHDLYRVFLPRGWFTPVTPGTWYVTLGGMVASDVHGKNHHRDGTFGEHVRSLRLRVADGRILECSRESEPDLFRATLGGMGLTGHILEVEVALARVPSPWIHAEIRRVDDIHAYLRALADAAPTWPMTFGWIDCLSRGAKLGRGILYCGRWADPAEAPATFPAERYRVSVPFRLPEWFLSPTVVRLFNEALYRSRRPLWRGIVHPQSFFYPLDSIRNWNRMYGRRGVTQYQCVIPEAAGPEAVRSFLELLTARGGASFLCVIKDCGAEGTGLLSFPKPGVSVALDIPIRDDTQALVDVLNEKLIGYGGRIYLAKDAFTRPEHFRAMESRLDEWMAIRRKWDPEGRFRSAQSVRLFGDPA